MGEYKKITKEDINFPNYCLFFIEKIQEAIDINGITCEEFLSIDIDTLYPYCSEAFDLIVKTFEKKDMVVMTPTYKMEKEDGIRHYHYKWKLKKAVDDLPF